MLASMKYLRPHEISAPRQRCSRLIIYDSNKAAVEISAAYKRCWWPQMLASRLLLFGLRRISTLSPSQSGWRALLSEGVASPPCSPQVESAHRSAQLIWAASLPYCTGTTCLNIRVYQMLAATRIFWPLFLGKIKNLTRLISVLSLPFKFVWNHKSCLNSAASLLGL